MNATFNADERLAHVYIHDVSGDTFKRLADIIPASIEQLPSCKVINFNIDSVRITLFTKHDDSQYSGQD